MGVTNIQMAYVLILFVVTLVLGVTLCGMGVKNWFSRTTGAIFGVLLLSFVYYVYYLVVGLVYLFSFSRRPVIIPLIRWKLVGDVLTGKLPEILNRELSGQMFEF